MSVQQPKRLPKEQRREQLLDTALAIVREQGTDAITLSYVAERAGVSKPIAYGHFGTRAGLLTALYRRIDEQQLQLLLEAMESAPRRLAGVARLIGVTYMHCSATVGAEWHALSAALKGNEEISASQQEMIDRYVDVYRSNLQPLTTLPEAELHVRCVAVVGAAEAISLHMLRGCIDEPSAAEQLSSLIVAWLPGRVESRPSNARRAAAS